MRIISKDVSIENGILKIAPFIRVYFDSAYAKMKPSCRQTSATKSSSFSGAFAFAWVQLINMKYAELVLW